MTGLRTTVGICVLCAFALAGITTAPAAAVGARAYTCEKLVPPEVGPFTDSHCTNRSTGVYGHVSIAFGATTEYTGGNANTSAETTSAAPSFFHTTVTGVELELKATTVTTSGSMENKEVGGEAVAHGVGTITYEGITVVKPGGGVCTVEGGKVVTKEVTAITVASGLKIQPKEGSTFAEFNIINGAGTCPEAVKGNYKVTGSIIGAINGATVNTTRAGSTEQSTLKTRNKAAGLDGTVTLKAKKPGDPTCIELAVT